LREEWALQVSRKGRKDRKEGFRVVVFLLAEQFQEFQKNHHSYNHQFHRALLFDPPLATL
jgi:hypothetical protein